MVFSFSRLPTPDLPTPDQSRRGLFAKCRSRRRPLPATFVLAAVLGLLAGCAAIGAPSDTEGEVALLKVDEPLREPAWVDGAGTLLVLGESEPVVVRLDPNAEAPPDEAPGPDAVVRSRTFEGVGEDLVPNPEEPESFYLPQPESGRVAVLDTRTLETVDSLDAGISPRYASLAAQAGVLFAISKDGETVAGWDVEEEGRKFPSTSVSGGEEAVVEAPEKGLDPAFWVAGPEGLSYYSGEPPERLVGLPMGVRDIAVDRESAQRAYVIDDEDPRRVVAVEGDPEGLDRGELEVMAHRRLYGEVECLASDELHVFAAMRGRLVVMRRETLEVVESVRFEGPARDATPSGITVGKEDVYVTLSEEPYVLSVDKP